MRKLIAAIAATLMLSTPALSWESIDEMNDQIDQTNFIVHNGCSGTLIDRERRLIVTAHHCIARYVTTVTRKEVGEDGKITSVQYEKRERVPVRQKDYKDFENVGSITYQTNILDFEQARDLAILQLVGDNLRSTMEAPILPIDFTVVRGEDVVAVGNPRMLDASVTSGVISSTNRTFRVPWALNELVPMLQFDANIQGGSSGGALFNTEGQYIGTTVASFPGSDLSLAIPVFELYELLKRNCYAELYDPWADDEVCRNPEAEEETDAAE